MLFPRLATTYCHTTEEFQKIKNCPMKSNCACPLVKNNNKGLPRWDVWRLCFCLISYSQFDPSSSLHIKKYFKSVHLLHPRCHNPGLGHHHFLVTPISRSSSVYSGSAYCLPPIHSLVWSKRDHSKAQICFCLKTSNIPILLMIKTKFWNMGYEELIHSHWLVRADCVYLFPIL